MSDFEDTTTLDQTAPETPASEEVDTDDLNLEGTSPDGSDNENEEIADDEFEEIEHAGKKHKLPKELKPLLLMQQDYTKKTQEVAEARKALEAERLQQADEGKEVAEAKSDLRNADRMIQQYKALDWATLRQNDPDLAQVRFMELQEWKDHRDELNDTVANASEKHALETQQVTAKRTQEAVTELKRDIPNWDTVAPKVAEFAVKVAGFTPHELSEMADARLGKLLHRAMLGDQLLAKQKAAAKASTSAEAEPIKPSTSIVKGRAPAAPGLSDRLSADEWVKLREQELRRQ